MVVVGVVVMVVVGVVVIVVVGVVVGGAAVVGGSVQFLLHSSVLQQNEQIFDTLLDRTAHC